MTNMRQKTFNLLLTVSQGVTSDDNYYGSCCAFCRDGEPHDPDCETLVALEILKTDFSDLYQEHLDNIAAEQKRQRDLELAAQHRSQIEFKRKHTTCPECAATVKKCDINLHVGSRRCLKQQRENVAFAQLCDSTR